MTFVALAAILLNIYQLVRQHHELQKAKRLLGNTVDDFSKALGAARLVNGHLIKELKKTKNVLAEAVECFDVLKEGGFNCE